MIELKKKSIKKIKKIYPELIQVNLPNLDYETKITLKKKKIWSSNLDQLNIKGWKWLKKTQLKNDQKNPSQPS